MPGTTTNSAPGCFARCPCRGCGDQRIAVAVEDQCRATHCLKSARCEAGRRSRPPLARDAGSGRKARDRCGPLAPRRASPLRSPESPDWSSAWTRMLVSIRSSRRTLFGGRNSRASASGSPGGKVPPSGGGHDRDKAFRPRPGWLIATNCAIMPPMEAPTIWARRRRARPSGRPCPSAMSSSV